MIKKLGMKNINTLILLVALLHVACAGVSQGGGGYCQLKERAMHHGKSYDIIC